MIMNFMSQYWPLLVSLLAAISAAFSLGWRIHSSFSRIDKELKGISTSTKVVAEEMRNAVLRLSNDVKDVRGSILQLDIRVTSLAVALAEMRGEIKGRSEVLR